MGLNLNLIALQLIQLRRHRGNLLFELSGRHGRNLRLFGIRYIELRQVAINVGLSLLYPDLHTPARKVLVAAVDRLELAAIDRHQGR